MKKKDTENQNSNSDNQNLENIESGGKGYGYTSFALAVAAVVFLPLIFVINIYALCASFICALASLAFYNSQKPRGLFTLVKIARIIAYVALILCIVLLIGATIYASLV